MKFELLNKECKNSSYVLKVSTRSQRLVIEGHKCKGHDYVDRSLSCPCGKDVYLSYQDAQRALRLRGTARKSKKRVYHCSICGHYHLTTNDGVGRLKKKYVRCKSERWLKRSMYNYSECELQSLKEKKANAFSLKAFQNKMALRVAI